MLAVGNYMYRYTESLSGLGQESYVLSVLEEKKNGYYVELGSGDPLIESNTYLLETRFDWTGLALDTDKELVDKYNNQRKNVCLNENALKFNYRDFFKENNYPKQIDYLQIDIDGHDEGNCLLALVALPLNEYRFSVITIEHDVILDYRRAPMRDAQRQILSSLGYVLTAQLMGEDWWIDSNAFHAPNNMMRHYIHPNFYGTK